MTNASPLAQAIANSEGFGTANAPTITEYNNPGALFSDGAPRQFSSLSDGINALESQIGEWLNGSSKIANANTTIAQLAQEYTGGDSPNTWATNTSDFLGVTPDTTLGQLQNMGLTSPDYSINGMNQRITGQKQSPGIGDTLKSKLETGALTWLLSTRFVFAVLGVLLIWGGIMGFDKTKDIIVSTGKAVAEGAMTT